MHFVYLMLNVDRTKAWNFVDQIYQTLDFSQSNFWKVFNFADYKH